MLDNAGLNRTAKEQSCRARLKYFLFAAFEAANFQIDFFGNPVMRTTQ